MNFFRQIALVAVVALPVVAQATPRTLNQASTAKKPVLVTFGSTGHGSGQRFFAGSKPATTTKAMSSLKPAEGGPKLISIGSTGTGSGQRFVNTVSTVQAQKEGAPKLISIGSTGTGSGQRFVDTVATAK